MGEVGGDGMASLQLTFKGMVSRRPTFAVRQSRDLSRPVIRTERTPTATSDWLIEQRIGGGFIVEWSSEYPLREIHPFGRDPEHSRRKPRRQAFEEAALPYLVRHKDHHAKLVEPSPIPAAVG